jgi:hypothetical protein
MNRNRFWVRPAAVAIGAVVIFAAVAVIIVTKTAADRSASLVVALVGGLAIGVLFLIVGQPWRSPSTPRYRLMKLVDAYVKTNFGPTQKLDMLWSGMLKDLPSGAGGFIRVGLLHGPTRNSQFANLDARSIVTETPLDRATAFVYRSVPDGTFHVIIFGDRREAAQPLVPPRKQVEPYTFPANGARVGRLPAWAIPEA